MRFAGIVGYGHNEEVTPGRWEDVIVEKTYFGDVIRNGTTASPSDQSIHDDVSVSHSISVVADAFAQENFVNIRFVVWAGVAWKVSNKEIRHPRLILQLGGDYNGPRADPDTP